PVSLESCNRDKPCSASRVASHDGGFTWDANATPRPQIQVVDKARIHNRLARFQIVDFQWGFSLRPPLVVPEASQWSARVRVCCSSLGGKQLCEGLCRVGRDI